MHQLRGYIPRANHILTGASRSSLRGLKKNKLWDEKSFKNGMMKCSVQIWKALKSHCSCVQVKSVSHDLEQLNRLLHMVKSLVQNPYLYLGSYVRSLVSSVMYCILEPLAASINPLNDHWTLRDYAALLLSHIFWWAERNQIKVSACLLLLGFLWLKHEDNMTWHWWWYLCILRSTE